MERAIAVKKLGKLLGSKFGYRINAKAPSPEDRETARAALSSAIEERNSLREKSDARYKAILAADDEYQRLHAAFFAARAQVEKLQSVTRHHKITVGVTVGGLFFHVKAEGDSWEEVIDKVTATKAAA